MLLTYYDKQRSGMFVDNILSYADSVVKVEDWRYSWPTDPDQNNPAAKDYTFRAVVTVPARIFDAILKTFSLPTWSQNGCQNRSKSSRS